MTSTRADDEEPIETTGVDNSKQVEKTIDAKHAELREVLGDEEAKLWSEELGKSTIFPLGKKGKKSKKEIEIEIEKIGDIRDQSQALFENYQRTKGQITILLQEIEEAKRDNAAPEDDASHEVEEEVDLEEGSSPKPKKETASQASIEEKKKAIAGLEKDFFQDVKKFEKTCNKFTIGQKVFVAACTFAGALLGAVVGYVAGAVIGGLIGGTVGSVLPGLGTLVGAAVGGNVAGVVAAAKGLGIGTAIGAGIAMTVIAALTGYGASKAVKSEKPLFGTERQQHLFAMTHGMRADIHKQTHPENTSGKHVKKAK